MHVFGGGNTSALPTLLYGYGNWAIRDQDEYRITSAEMKFVRRRQNTHGRITKPVKIFYQNLILTQL
jgi:hypothetical protein